MPTPFELDCQRKSGALMEFRDERKRRNTCRCGIIRQYHWQEVESGRCRRFRAMNRKEWAEWVGVDIADA